MKRNGFMKVKRILCTILFLALVVGILGVIEQAFRVRKPSVTNMYEEYMNLQENTLDVLFLGSSHNYYTVSPVAIWEKTGISSYVLGGPSMRMNVAAEVLKKALKTQSPEVVFLEGYSLSYTTPQTTPYLHYIYDCWPFSWEKFQSVRRVATDNEAVKELMFPIMTYHSRWKDITPEEIETFLQAEESYSGKGHIVNYAKSSKVVLDGSLYSYKREIAETEKKALEEIKTLCESKGIRLVLWAAPSGKFNEKLANNIQTLADAHQLPFLNLNEPGHIAAMGIDVAEHFCDTSHLNEYGAEIASEFLAQYIQEMGVETSQEFAFVAQWEDYCKLYHHRKQERLLRGQNTASKFLTQIQNLENCTVLFVEGDEMTNIRPYTSDRLAELELLEGIKDKKSRFVAVMNANGKMEVTSAESGDTKLSRQFGENAFVLQTAKGENGLGSITCNGKELLPRKAGLGIVVYDNLRQEVLISAVLPLKSENNKIIRAS